MKTNFHEMTTDELKVKLISLKSELFNLRFKQATGSMENPMVLVFCKKDIARCMTILREREMGIKRKVVKGAKS